MFFKRSRFDIVCALAKESAQIDLKALNRKLDGAIEKHANNPDFSSISTEGLLVKSIAKALEVCVDKGIKISTSELLGTGDGIFLAMKMDSWRNDQKYGEDIREEYWKYFIDYDDQKY